MSDPSAVSEDSVLVMAVDLMYAARLLFSAGSLEQTLAQIVELSVSTIEGCEFASISLVEGDTVPSSIYPDAKVIEIREIQRRLGEGPSIDATTQQVTFYAAELGSDERWPRFGPEVASLGVHSMLALPLAAEGTRGCLNLYASRSAAFDITDRARGLLLASIAALASSFARIHEDEERRAENLHAALATRELIGQAQGILIERERITADQAFAILRQASQHLNVKLREVAQRLVDTGERPEDGQPHTP
ncbi:MAG TPA: GAF and ANTAR domain-containing protein [Acidimicrobiales bacterium]|nr:GAF and ANTAR domain-containing protein [Acidimicrobiales bacterium]